MTTPWAVPWCTVFTHSVMSYIVNVECIINRAKCYREENLTRTQHQWVKDTTWSGNGLSKDERSEDFEFEGFAAILHGCCCPHRQPERGITASTVCAHYQSPGSNGSQEAMCLRNRAVFRRLNLLFDEAISYPKLWLEWQQSHRHFKRGGSKERRWFGPGAGVT